MTNEEYHADPRIGGSFLRRCYPTPAHAAYAIANPIKPTKQMDLGTAIHCACLTPDRFDEEVWVKPANPQFRKKDGTIADSPWMTTEGKAILESVRESNRVPIDESDEPRVWKTAEVFQEWLAQYAGDKLFERPHFAGDYKCKPDLLIVEPDRVICVSVKTSALSLHRFRYSIVSKDTGEYDIAEAHYADVLQQVYSRPVTTIMLHITTTGPIMLTPIILPPDVMANGEAARQVAFRNLAEAKAGRVSHIAPTVVLTLPRYLSSDSDYVEVDA